MEVRSVAVDRRGRLISTFASGFAPERPYSDQKWEERGCLCVARAAGGVNAAESVNPLRALPRSSPKPVSDRQTRSPRVA